MKGLNNIKSDKKTNDFRWLIQSLIAVSSLRNFKFLFELKKSRFFVVIFICTKCVKKCSVVMHMCEEMPCGHVTETVSVFKSLENFKFLFELAKSRGFFVGIFICTICVKKCSVVMHMCEEMPCGRVTETVSVFDWFNFCVITLKWSWSRVVPKNRYSETIRSTTLNVFSRSPFLVKLLT